MFTATATIVVDRPIDEVWDVVADRRRDVEWRAECVAMELIEGDDATEPGAVFREVIRFGPRTVGSKLRLTDISPPHRLGFEGFEPAWIPSTNTLTLEELGRGTRVSFMSEAEVRRPWPLADRLFRWLFERSLRRELANLKAYLEDPPDAD